jgi:TMEM175 potassium channel family protein
MSKTRLEAFSDGVVAILITIMVLELRLPNGVDWSALGTLAPTFLVYVLSFINLGIYWNNHHHLLHAVSRVNGTILWANLHLLFWLSLVPFTTRWMGENHNAPLPTAIYGVVLLLAGVAFTILVRALLKSEGPKSKLAAAIGRDVKGYTSLVLYAIAIPVAFVNQVFADALYVAVAVIWFVPDRRIESRIG